MGQGASWWLALVVLVIASSLGALGAGAAEPPAFRDGVVLVRFDAGVTTARQQAVLDGVGARLGRLSAPRSERIGLRLLRVGRGRVPAVVRALNAAPDVRFAEPDYLMRVSGVPNDPDFGLQWGLANGGQDITGSRGTPGADEGAPAAWSVSTGSEAVVTAVTDSGVDYNHPDLAGNIWANPGGVGGCAKGTHGYDVLASDCDPMDDNDHGSHVAGILGAVGDNGVGVTGVNWRTRILPVKWLDSAGWGSTSGLIAALDWVIAAKQSGVNVRVVNDSATYVGTPYSQALSNKIDELAANDILFVTAAGNTADDNDDPTTRRYPCGYSRPNELCVTASDFNDNLWTSSNYGLKTVNLAAPGVDIYSTLSDGGYGYMSGGSMAAPQVAGAAALRLALGYRSATDLRGDLLRAVDVLPAFLGKVSTGGRLNLCKLVPGCGASAPADSPARAPAGSPPGAPLADITKPVVTRYALSRATFRAFRHGGSIATSRGSRVAYTLSEPGSARFNVERAVRERNCRRRCTRYIRMRGSFIRPSQGGRNSFRFSGRLRGRRLRTGSYRLA